MSRFREILHDINDRLHLPQPVKSRILLEIASDLDDLYQSYREQGLGDEEAAERTAEKFELSDEALEELVQIHESAFRILLGRLSEQARSRWERSALFVLVLFVAFFAGRNVLSEAFFAQAGRFVWPVIGLSCAALLLFLQQVYKLYVKKEHAVGRLRSGPPWLLAIGGACLLTGCAGLAAETYRLANEVASASVRTLPAVVEWAIGGSALMTVSLFAAIASAIAWFIIMNKIAGIEEAEASWLLK